MQGEIDKINANYLSSKQTIYDKDRKYNTLLAEKNRLDGDLPFIISALASAKTTKSIHCPPTPVIDEFGNQKKDDKNKLIYKYICDAEGIKANRDIGELEKNIKKNRIDFDSVGKAIVNQSALLDKQISNIYTQSQITISGISMQINNRQTNYPIDKAKAIQNANDNDDLLAMLDALGEMKTFGNSVWWASLLITILFILLETSPILVKLLSKRGPYDEILERVEYEIFLNQQKIISDKNDEINNILVEIKEVNKLKGEVRLKTEKIKLSSEMKANESLLDYIASKQADIAKIAVDNWYVEESKKMNSNQTQQNSKNTQQQKPPPFIARFEDVNWKVNNSKDEIFYLFKNGQPTINELEYDINGKKETGTWQYLTGNNVVEIVLPDFTETYFVEELTTDSVKLKTKSKEFIELIKV